MKPVVYQNKTFTDYAVDEDGNIWSFKRDQPRKIVPNLSGACRYPTVGLRQDGRPVSATVHRIVAETLIPRRRPKEFRPATWKSLNDAERALVYQAYEVNHIDHDTTNYHPSNLEWISRRRNLEKRNAHYFYMN